LGLEWVSVLRGSGEYVLLATTLVTLIYASILDVKSRDIPEVTWLPASVIAIVLNLLSGNYDFMHTLFSLVPAGLVLIMAFLGLMGGADSLALLMIGISFPKFIAFPISLLTLIYSLIPPILLMLYYLVSNLILHRDVFRKINCAEGRYAKYVLPLLGKPLTINSYLARKFVYPLTIPLSNSEYVCRTYFGDDEEEEKVKRGIEELVRAGVLRPNDKIIVTPALPHILFILIGFIAAILTPQKYLASLIYSLITH